MMNDIIGMLLGCGMMAIAGVVIGLVLGLGYRQN
jgi:hypothetical protein